MKLESKISKSPADLLDPNFKSKSMKQSNLKATVLNRTHNFGSGHASTRGQAYLESLTAKLPLGFLRLKHENMASFRYLKSAIFDREEKKQFRLYSLPTFIYYYCYYD